MSAPLFKRLRRGLRVRALLLLLPLLRRLPRWLWRPLAVAAGTVSYWVVTRERQLALAHLALAYPGESAAFHRKTARAAFISLVQSGLTNLTDTDVTSTRFAGAWLVPTAQPDGPLAPTFTACGRRNEAGARVPQVIFRDGRLRTRAQPGSAPKRGSIEGAST